MRINQTMKIKTAADQIAEILRNDIFSGNFLPGSRLKENEISQLLNISRTPVREAFRILESEGLVEITSNKGVQIPIITKEELDEVFELRILLEVYCIRKFVNTIDENQIQDMEDILKKSADAINQKDYLSYFNNSINFHAYYMKRCQNERLYSTFFIVRNSIRCAQILLQKNTRYYRESINKHKEIMGALTERDSDKCEKLLRQHLGANCQTMKKSLDNIMRLQKEM